MIEKYYLNENKLPVLHDCLIDDMEIKDGFLVFVFEKDISYHDSIIALKPEAKSLIMRFHLIESDFDVFKWKTKGFFSKFEGFMRIENDKILGKQKKELAYLYHNVGYQSIIIKLYQAGYILLELEVDYIEYEWIK